jgi:hypothetical protein
VNAHSYFPAPVEPAAGGVLRPVDGNARRFIGGVYGTGAARYAPAAFDRLLHMRAEGTGTETIAEGRTDIRVDEGDHERFSHYVDKAKLTEAYVVGTPVIALCGKVWVPSRDHTKFPVCPECKRLYDLGPEGRRREWERRSQDA